MLFLIIGPLLVQLIVCAELIDQIAIVVDKSIIKDSDIARDIRVTQLLNNEFPQINAQERKKTAQKLIDQMLLREEIRTGAYPTATEQEVNSQFKALQNRRFHSPVLLQTSLKKYQLDETQLREQIRWQITVLHFIDARFKPAAIIQDSAVDAYYHQHEDALKSNNPNASVDDLKSQAREILAGEETNRLLFSWLEERRKQAKITFLEEGLS